MMRAAFVCAGAALAMSIGVGQAQAQQAVSGVIVRFECGDNCYLTIRDDKRKERTGLCSAPQCAKWNEATQMPKSFVGRRVRVTLGRGAQYDGGGRLMGHTTAFATIEWLK